MTKDELSTVVQQEVKGLASYLEEDDFTNAVDEAERETGWSLPQSLALKIKWLKERAKRHLFFMLWSESAHKFKYKQYNLQNRFSQYEKLIAKMDLDWEKFLEESLLLLEGVDAFGTKIDAGFAYENETGRDTTYFDDNLVVITPKEADY